MPRLFRLFVHASPRREPLADTFTRVVAILGRPGNGIARLLFSFEDNPVSTVSGVERIVRALPETARFLHEPPPPSGVRELSNFPAPWIGSNPNAPGEPLGPDVLDEILRGIPRRFPVWRAGVTFDGVDWPGTGERLPAGPARGERDPVAPSDWRYLFPSVSIQRWHGRASGHAIVECPDPAAELDRVTAGKLARIGRVERQDVRAGFSPEELAEHQRRKAEAEAVVTEFKARTDAWLADQVPLPHGWPPARASRADAGRFSLKAPLVRQFRPMGYRRVPEPAGSATFTLLKPTTGHHVLQLHADRGPWSRYVSCLFGFVGLAIVHGWNLPADERRAAQYAPRGQGDVDHVVANWVAIVQALERDLVPRLEAIYGDGPSWFPSITMSRRP